MAGLILRLARLMVVPLLVVFLAVVLLSFTGQKPEVLASTTTSLYATGLLDRLAEEWGRESGVVVQFNPVGSGRALQIAANGDACMVFVHAPNLEAEYIRRGLIEEGRKFAYNYFIIAGPPGDPAGVAGAGSAVEAFKRIYQAGEEGRALFVSRGDESGTHAREKLIWKLAGLDPAGRDWYIESGQGMSETLMLASEKRAYTLSDIGTYLKLRGDGRISLNLYEIQDKVMINVYSVYLSSKCTGAEREAALDFIEFITGERGQGIIASYGVEEYGQPLFYPAVNASIDLDEAWAYIAGLG